MASGRAVPRACDTKDLQWGTEHRNKAVSPFSWKGLGIAVYCVPFSSQQKNTSHRYTLRPQSEWEASPAPSVTLCLPAMNCFGGKKAQGCVPPPRAQGKPSLSQPHHYYLSAFHSKTNHLSTLSVNAVAGYSIHKKSTGKSKPSQTGLE